MSCVFVTEIELRKGFKRDIPLDKEKLGWGWQVGVLAAQRFLSIFVVVLVVNAGLSYS